MLTRSFYRCGGNGLLQLSGWMLALFIIASPATATQADFDEGYALGLQAYTYGIPLVTMEWTYQAQINTLAPVNKFYHYFRFATPSDTLVVAPNFDTLYGIAWLDLSRGPVVIHVPEELYSVANGVNKRFWVIPLYDPYTNNFENLGSVKQTEPGDYAVVGPKHRNRRLPPNMKRINSNYDRVWIILRIYAINDNPNDIAFVNTLQELTTLTALNPSWENSQKETQNELPVMPTGLDFYDELCRQLSMFPPPSADDAFLADLFEIGVGPGLKPSTDTFLSEDKVAGMIAAANNGTLAIRRSLSLLYQTNFVKLNGYLVLSTGTYGTDFSNRAIVTVVGLGALTPDQAMYPIALLDRTAKPLVGTKNYKVRIPAGGLPPVNGFWSLTMYNTQGFLIENSINRYLINDRSQLYYNADGSLDLYIQSTQPTDPTQAQNWLPSPPNAAFQLIWRLYAVEPSAILSILAGTGWKAPAIMPVA